MLSLLMLQLGNNQQPNVESKPDDPRNIDYYYDIAGPSIFANKEQEKKYVSPYGYERYPEAQTGGSVDDLLNIMKGNK
jgi:hypothetical protein